MADLALRGAAGADSLGEVSAAWRIASNALMLLGWQREQPSPEGTASLPRAAGPPGRFTRLAWAATGSNATGYHFLAAVQLPQADPQGGDTLLLAGRRASQDGVLARLPPKFLDAAGFATELARATFGEAGTSEAGAAVARFLTDVFAKSATVANPAVHTMVSCFLDQASTLDGCVELLGAMRDQCAYLQGWGRPLPGACEVILAGAAMRRFIAQEVCFTRPDITAPSLGHGLILPADAAEAGLVETVFLLAQDGLRRRPVLPDSRRLSEAETAGHFRDILPSLRCDAETRAVLTAALRPRYEGRLTLYDGGHPVRLEIDTAVSGGEAGCYLTGWLYDPSHLVQGVHLRSTLGPAARLDDCWTRIPRQDVTEGFAADLSLPPGEPGRNDHGFAVHVPSQGVSYEAGGCYLEIALSASWSGFVPLVMAPLRDAAAADRLLTSVDMFKPSGHAIIARQLAPFLAGTAAFPVVVASVLPSRPAAANLIVVPLASNERPRVLLAQLLNDRLGGDEAILFVCGDDWTDADVAALDHMSRFYGAPAATARIAGPVSIWTALMVAAAHADAERVLILTAGTVGSAPGWRQALYAISRANSEACLSPTVLYEDASIRFAGLDGIEPLTAPPYLRVHRRLAGLPASFAPRGPAVPVKGVSAACCLIPRTVLALLQARVSTVAAAWEPELDLLLQLDAAGAHCLLAPSVQVYAPDEVPDANPAERATRLAARWCIRARLTGAA